MPLLRTDCIVLRKTPFQETSLIVSALSPAYGRVDFLVKGGRGLGKKHFPAAELFRELTIQFREPKSGDGLATLAVCDPLASHDDIAANTGGYLAACDLAAFLLRNTRPMLEIPRTCAALSAMLRVMAGKHGAEPWIPLVKLVFFQENGFLPDPSGEQAERQRAVLGDLLDYACGERSDPPRISRRYWDSLLLWIRSLEHYHALS